MNRIVMEMDQNGNFQFSSDEPVEIYVVCDHAPDDRVYQMNVDVGKKQVDDILADCPVGHADDAESGKHEPTERKHRIMH
jgi:hypothetical protein